MRSVNVSELKAKLSAHIQLVKHGEEILIRDRNKPVARIVPCLLDDLPARERELIAQGILTPPLKRRGAKDPLPEPAGNVPDEVMQEVWRNERNER